MARATRGRPVKLQWMRDDEFMWAPYGSAMAMKLSGGIDGQGNIVSWSHEMWSHPHSTRPGSSAGVNLLAARHLAQTFQPVLPADVPQPAGDAASSVTGRAVDGSHSPSTRTSPATARPWRTSRSTARPAG